MLRTVEIHIKGKVQGVWFRSSAKAQADALDIQGSVRNMRDGTVNILASGDAHRIQEFIDWCWKGPELARVDEVAVSDVTDKQILPGFEIRRP